MRKVLVCENVTTAIETLADNLGITEIIEGMPSIIPEVIKTLPLPIVVVESATNPYVFLFAAKADEVDKVMLDSLIDLVELPQEKPLSERVLALENIVEEPSIPPHSQHIGKVISIDVTKAKPMKIARKWQGVVYNVDCLVSLNIAALYQAGKIAVNDYVIVSFIDEIPDTQEIELAIVTDKVFKSWT